MAASSRALTDAIIEWFDARLALVHTDGAPRPRWPLSPAQRRALEQGRIVDAVAMADRRGRFVLVGYLRRDALHLFVAHDELLDREVAIKLIRAPGRAATSRVAREARLTAKLSHPHIVEIYEVDPDSAYIVLERLDADLRDLAAEAPGLVLDAYCQAGRGLAAAHAYGIWHLDFKPENVLLRLERDAAGVLRRVWAKVADFGLASSPTPELLPRGTPGYEAPERRRGEGIDGALADQYSFALSVWESLTGDLRPPCGAWMLPPGLVAVLARALAVDPLRRWADMTQLVDAMEEQVLEVAPSVCSSKRELELGRRLLERALGFAECGLLVSARRCWSEAEVRLAGRAYVLGCGGLDLGRALLEGAGLLEVSTREQGYAEALKVLEVAFHNLRRCGELTSAEEAKRTSIEVCERWLRLHEDNTPTRRELLCIDRALRRLRVDDDGVPKRKTQPGSGPVGAAREPGLEDAAGAAREHCPAAKTPPLWPFGELHGPMEATSWKSPATGGLTLQPLEVADARGRASTAARSARVGAPSVRAGLASSPVAPSTPQPKPSKLES